MTPDDPRNANVLEESGPIFIIGSPRSGTSILAWSLAQHPQLWTSGESDVVYELYGRGQVDRVYAQAYARPHGWFRTQGVEQAEFLRYLGHGLNALFKSRSKTRRWIDQTPLYTLMVDTLVSMFPDARFLHIMRDGREVVNSMMHFRTLFEKDGKLEWPEGNFVPLWMTDFRNACETWSEHVNTAMAFARREPARCMTVRYTDLVVEPENTFEEIQSFLGVKPQGSPAEYLRTHPINSSFRRVEEASDTAEIRVSPWSSWSREQKQIFVQKAGGTLLMYGLVSEDDMRVMEREAGITRDNDMIARTRLVNNLRATMEGVVPTNARVLVVSRGDETLVGLPGYEAWHFPRGLDGGYAGYYPTNDEEAIGHLERLHVKGAQYLLFPAPAFWWLEFYSAFRQYLQQRFTIVVSTGDCIIFELEAPGSDPLARTNTSQQAPVS